TNPAYRYKMSAPKNTKNAAENPQTNQSQILNQTTSQSTFFSSSLAYFISKTTTPKNNLLTTSATNSPTEYAKEFISINIKDLVKLTFTVTFLVSDFITNTSLQLILPNLVMSSTLSLF